MQEPAKPNKLEQAVLSLPEVRLRNTPVSKKRDLLDMRTRQVGAYEKFFCRPTNPRQSIRGFIHCIARSNTATRRGAMALLW